jgi:hypothetical protein
MGKSRHWGCEQHFLKSCGIAIVEVLFSSCGIAIANSKKSCACPPLLKKAFAEKEGLYTVYVQINSDNIIQSEFFT